MKTAVPHIKISTIRKGRRPRGFSLIAITAMILISSLWVSAMMAMILPTFERMNLLAASGILRSSAETGLDYVIADLCNNVNGNGTTNSAFDATFGGSHRTDISNYIDTLLGKPGVSVSVTVYNETPAPVAAPTGYTLPNGYPTPAYTTPNGSIRVGTNSFLYDPLIDQQVIQNWGTSGLQNPYRRIEATATYGIASMTIRVVLQPTFLPPIPRGLAVFGNSGVDSVGLVTTDSYGTPPASLQSSTMDLSHGRQPSLYQNSSGNWNLYGNVGSNMQVNEVVASYNTPRGVTYGGSRFEFPTPLSSAQQLALQQTLQGEFATGHEQEMNASVKVLDSVYSNGTTEGYWPQSAPSNIQPYDNVFGLSKSTNATQVDPTYPSMTGPAGVVNTAMNQSSLTLPGVSPSPANTPSIGTVSLSGSQTLVFQDGAPMPSSVDWTQPTITLPTGNYSITSLSLTNNASIVMNGTTATQLFIEGSTPSPAVYTDVNTSMNTGAGATDNFSIFYGGSQMMFLNGNIRSTVYAPNSMIMVGSNASDLNNAGNTLTTNFWGTLVGDTVILWGGMYDGGGLNMHFNAANAQSNDSISGSVAPLQVNGFRIVTWEELAPNALGNANTPYVVGPSSYSLKPYP